MNLDVFFEPKTVAVIGASEKEGTIGRAIMLNLLEKFRGKIIPINIKYDQVFGLKCYKSVLEVPESIDLVVIAIPAPSVPQVLEECGKKGVKGAIIISAGFKEIGGEGIEREQKVVEIARKYGMRIIGPNCLGVYDAHTGLDTIFNPSDRQAKPSAGNVAFISQSGALGAALLDWFTEQGIGMSKFVSYGNAADVTESDLIEYLAEDSKTSIIALYIEGVSNGRRFLCSIVKAIAKGKPVIVLKAGKTERGGRAVASHTGSLAGSYELYLSAIKQVGGILVDDLHDLLIAINALQNLPRPKGNRLAIVTNGGGAGVLATDSAEIMGLKLAELSQQTIDRLRKVLPPAASPYNPVDILGDAPADRYRKAIEIVLSDDDVDMVMVIALLQSPALNADELIDVLKYFKDRTSKPFVFIAPGGSYTMKYIEKARKLGIPAFRDPVEGVKALTYVYEFSKAIERARDRVSLFC